MQPVYQTENVTVYCGDAMEILPQLASSSIDAVITDPPYSSGGQFRSDRAKSTVEKYVSAKYTTRNEFSGDNLDQRVYMVWSSWWLSAARECCNDGAILCCFTDWRQIPALTDAIQCGGWVWRNLCTWWKPGCRMIRGRFSSSAEHLVYATNGAHKSDGAKSSQNVISCPTLAGDQKDHIAEKPPVVIAWALSVSRPDALILDPFAGVGGVAIAAIKTGRRCILIEREPQYIDIIIKRLKAEESQLKLF